MRLTFYLFRVSLIPRKAAELFADSVADSTKNDLVLNALQSHPSGVYRKTKYQISNFKSASTRFATGRLFRPKRAALSMIDPKTGDLVDDDIPSNVWTHYFYIGLGHQIFGIASKVDFFNGKPSNIADILQVILASSLESEPFVPIVEPLSVSKDFWDAINNAFAVTRLRFDLIPPNVFGGAKKLRDMLNTLQVQANVKRYKQEFGSKPKDSLIITKDGFGSEAEYVSKGGGEWRIDTEDSDGRRHSFSSNQSVRTIGIEVEDEAASIESYEDELTAHIDNDDDDDAIESAER